MHARRGTSGRMGGASAAPYWSRSYARKKAKKNPAARFLRVWGEKSQNSAPKSAAPTGRLSWHLNLIEGVTLATTRRADSQSQRARTAGIRQFVRTNLAARPFQVFGRMNLANSPPSTFEPSGRFTRKAFQPSESPLGHLAAPALGPARAGAAKFSCSLKFGRAKSSANF